MNLQTVSPLKTDYIRRLTDDTGIFQHTKFGVPDRSKGYTTDDNARALIAAVLLYDSRREASALDLIHTYASFIHYAQNEDGNFRNFMDYNRTFLEDRGSEDCQGRTLWALGFTLSQSSSVPENIKNTCRFMINQALPHLQALESPRAQAYAIIGLSCLLETPHALSYSFPFPHTEVSKKTEEFLPRVFITDLIENMAVRLHHQYIRNKGNGWHWFEDSLTYGNSTLPWALLNAARITGRTDLKETARESLDFLVSKTFSPEGYFKPVGSHGWQLRGEAAAPYDEQPIEASEMLLACKEAAIAFDDSAYLKRATLCYDWYKGRNSLNVPLIDPQTGGCYDGIHSTGLNLNQGSESIISYSIAHLVMHHE
ncbi:glycosyltransferase [Paenibacillus validus]|uniref:Glycosyltransferase n=1 Tax=Paenibacillus validus TaxID=44253 RepID=A0A7X2ZBC5_9BACL|nr:MULTISPECIES: glycosyltransferase [Paenibacillus]MED4600673.1 glycosyltransferase [Paenibacillus validus]MED4605312.1 glycosyltransferase [Paenibacillus validus]MUG71793.1 glycosyltransferase [Paenibacillus validus]